MYFLNVNILASQLLPPHWRDARLMYMKAILKPFAVIIQDFTSFRTASKSAINLTPQTMIIEHHLKKITGISYGIFIADTSLPNHFKIHIPSGEQNHLNEITVFLKKIIPAGRKYELIFY